MEMWVLYDSNNGIYAICDFEHQARTAKQRFKSISLVGLKIKKIIVGEQK